MSKSRQNSDSDSSKQSDEEDFDNHVKSILSQSAEQDLSEESDGELNVNFNQLLFGEDLADLGINLDGLENVDQMKPQDTMLEFGGEIEERQQQKNPEYATTEKQSDLSGQQGESSQFQQQRQDPSSSSDSGSDYEIPVMFYQNGGQTRVIQFTNIYIPNKEKQKNTLRLFNQKTMETVREVENEQDRAKKRKLKEDLKHVQKVFLSKATSLPVNPFLEDFYYLNSCKKDGTLLKKDDKTAKRYYQQSTAIYKSLVSNNNLVQKIQVTQNLKRKQQPRLPTAEQQMKLEVDANDRQQLVESCRVEELLPKIIQQSTSQTLTKRFPAPHYTQFEKQIYAHLQNLTQQSKIRAEDVSDHMMQETMIEQRYSQLKDEKGKALKRVKYWGELKDASSVQQLEKDNYICYKYQGKPQPAFKLKFQSQESTATSGMVENFKEYESVKNHQVQLYAAKKSKVTARSIMRYIRHKMGTISDQEFYEQELHDQKAESFQTEQKKDSTPIKNWENLDVHFNTRRMEIQQEIIRKKERKEHANQQNTKQATTTAYEPISLLEPILEEKQALAAAEQPDHTKKMHESDYSISSSSDSDEEQKDFIDLVNRQTGGRVLPTLGDELNHAKCIKDLSFYKLNWEDQDLSSFHRPNIQEMMQPHMQVQAITVQSKKDEKEKRLNPHDYFKDRFKLSLSKGKFSIFEHIDQHPLFINNFGMASRIKRYFFDDKQPSKKVFSNRKENVQTRHMGPHGELVLKGVPQFVDFDKPELGLIPSQRLDLLGQINTNMYKGITVLENKMYNAPLFYHSAQRTDFFCSLVLRKNQEQRVVIRELDSFYTVGQLEPKLEVYNPQSRFFQNFIKTRAKAYIIRFLQENHVIKFTDIVDFFPQIREQILKNSLKEAQIDIDRNGECKFTEKFDEERIKDIMTPEMICQYESARHGQFRLEQCGVTQILGADKISYSMGKFNREETDMTLRRIAKLIESEVLSTPWNLSSSFIRVKQDVSMMLIDGAGDPSYGHGGYSFIKMPLKISGDSLQGARENRMNLNPAIKNPKAVTRTDADLRKLQKKVIYDKLINFGLTAEQLKDKTRWQMVGMLRHYAPNLEENKKFARGVRYTSTKQREKYNTNCNEKFAKQIEYLSSTAPSYIHYHSEDEPDFTQTDLSKVAREGIGQNAADFTDDIQRLAQDATRKLSVETTADQVKDIAKIEDIPNYLNLLLLKLDKMPPQPGQQQQGIPIGGASTTQITTDFLESLSQEVIDDLKVVLQEKLLSGEINKKQNVICKMIRSLVNNGEDNKQEQDFTRVIFYASEKMIKKFNRARTKIEKDQGAPRNKKLRVQGGLTRAQLPGLTAENLMMETNKSGGGSIASKSIPGNQIAPEAQSIYSGANSRLKISRSSPLKKKKKSEPVATQPIIKINFNANNDQPMVQAPQPSTMKISFKLQSKLVNENDEEMVVDISEQDEGDELNEDEEYGNESGQLRNNDVVRLSTAGTKQQTKQRKLKKQPSTTQRFKSHGFAKEDFDYHQPISNNRSQRKRQQQCDQALNQIFCEILQDMWEQDTMQCFHNQVTKQDAPNYRDLIKRPICLKDMKNKTKRNEYKNSQDFLTDIELMRSNTQIFNGELHPITLLAMQLESFAKQVVQSKIEEILTLETLVKEVGQTV